MSTLLEVTEIEDLNRLFEHETPEKLLAWAVERFSNRLRLACSFGAEDVALVDIVSRHGLGIVPFVLDTGRLHQETYEVMDRFRAKYGIEFETYYPDTERIQRLLSVKGPNSFYESIENRKECCGIRKVEPLRRALSGCDGWVTGLRREQAVTRTSLPKIEIDESHGGIVKLNPLADWTEAQVWEYIRQNNVPYNALHDQGFPSIGCAPCTRAIQPGEDIRAGRWWWEAPEHKECGLHSRIQRS
ncbi:MAG: phosphoadenylyl-sulfate reductase [Armatimonadetes bacterium]|nr:phosphoadenylyl-sulfate reductase [Armatimonadota bacterium]